LARVSVSRAGGKLEAALVRFGLAGAVQGARAIDVGASTGGFTETLLAHGASHVVALDVGHGQMHPSLRDDPRVTSLEGVDFKRLSLNVAEGPFDFFAVDVSFVAARNMLRALAFRLRPGAQGVVLVKPQFELPDRQVKAAGVNDPALRQSAVEAVRERAEGLGFTLVAQADSPVAGASGTIEALAHLRFAERPASLPRPGESRGSARPAAKAAPALRDLRWFAVVAPGLEEVARREVATLGDARDVVALPGGVEWIGPPASGYRANLWLRIATRVLARAGEVEAREFAKLRRRAASLPWAAFVPRAAKLAVRASATRCRLYHTGALAETAVLAIADAVPGVELAGHDTAPDVTVLLRGDNDRFTFSVDASGERLHRRGARVEVGAAPLRETLAAGLLALADWRPELALVDPMCGAGTIVLEAATQALGRAPGLSWTPATEDGGDADPASTPAARDFAITTWPLLAAQGDALAAIAAEARAAAHATTPAPIAGSDRDPRVLDNARANAARAGLTAHIDLACRDVGDVRPPAAGGLVLANPPYGHRLGDPQGAARTYRALGRVLTSHFRGWRAAIVCPARLDPARALGFPATATFRLRNGGIPILLHVGELR
jgi:putative N6-adenine-specific DNA methylase